MRAIGSGDRRNTAPKSSSSRTPLTPHDWKILGAFGLLVGALALYDATDALLIVGVASAVVIVRNANYIEGMLP